MNFNANSDLIVFEIDQAGVHLRKAPHIDNVFLEALQGTLSEWESAADDEAYADLWKISLLVVPFPFTDQETSKRRPALLLSSAAFNISV